MLPMFPPTAPYCRLEPAGLEEMTRMVCDAFTMRQLEQLVRFSIGDQLYVEYVPEGLSGRDSVFILLEEMTRRGTTAELLRGVLKARPHRPDIQEAIPRLCPVAAAAAPETKAQVAAVVTGVEIVKGRLSDPTIRAGLVSSRQALASAADQVGQLEVYKRLHELLHKVQFRLFYQLENAARRFKTDPVANDLLANYISDLRDRAKEARPLAGALPDLPAARGLEFVWITEFDDTVAKLAAGRDALDDRQVLAGVRRLKSLLTVHPPRLNQLLALIAGTLPIRQLLDAFSAVIAGPDGAIAVRAARDGLVGLQPRLQAAVAEHTRWQELEKDLWLMENNLLDRAPQGRQADVPEVWNEIKLKITALR